MAETQPALTAKSANPSTQSYRPLDLKQEWTVDQWRELCTRFDVRAKELPLWHRELSGTSSWTIIRLRYQVGPLFGAGFDQRTLDPWTEGDIAGELGMSLKRVEETIAEAVKFWQKRRSEIPIEDRMLKKPNPGDTAGDAPQNDKPTGIHFTVMDQVKPEEVNSILAEAGFAKIADDDKRIYAARRISELKPWFEDKKSRETARQIVNAELNLRRYEELLLKDNLKAEEFRKLEEAQTKLAEKHQDLIAEIGADEIEEDAQRSLALDTYSSFARGMQEWYAKRERKLLDGIFTGDEVMWLLTPTDFREAQYRPDIVIRLKEALEPENLWSENYEPTPVQRSACRVLARIVKRASEEILAERAAENGSTDSNPADPPTEVEAEAPSEEPEPTPAPIPSFTRRINPAADDETFMVTS